MDSIAGGLLNILGVTGSGAATSDVAPRVLGPMADERALAEFAKAGVISDPNVWSYYNTSMNRPTTFEEMMRLWNDMSTWDMVTAALTELVEEACQPDPVTERVLWYECSDKKFEDELNGNFLVNIDAETILPSQLWHVAAFGNNFDRVHYEPETGIVGLAFAHPQDVRRYWLTKTRRCVGFAWAREKPDKDKVYIQRNTRIERVQVNYGNATPDSLWYPWDFCFTGDTKVSLLDGRELSLEQIQAEVGEGEFWVYSVTPTGRVVPGKAHSLRMTRKAAPVVEVELDNGEKVRCTPDHRFMLRDGSYREAGSLAPGDSLMPLYRKVSTVAVRNAGTTDVFDFEVDGQHNFALSAGVFVHNCHTRRMFRMRVNEHGEPVFDEAQGIYKKLRMAIDQMTVHRAQVQPDRYLVNIDVQEQPPLEQVRTVQRWRQTMRSKLAFGQGSDPGSLDAPGDFKSYYNAWALDTILWMAKPKGFSHAIEKLAGTANVPDVYDIEMLVNMFYSIIGMPKSWVGIGEAREGDPKSGRALLAQDMRFLRKVRALRKPVQQSYSWLGYLHAILKGEDVSNLEIRAKMSYIGTLEDQVRMEVLEKQVEIMDRMGDVLKKYNLEPDAWLDLVLRKYMHMPDEVVNALRTALPPEQPRQESRQPGFNRARCRQALDEIKRVLEHRHGKTLVDDLHRLLQGDDVFVRPKTRFNELCRMQALPWPVAGATLLTEAKDGLVASSFDQFTNATPTVATPGASGVEPGYRRWSPAPPA
jgi:hypothetical protein